MDLNPKIPKIHITFCIFFFSNDSSEARKEYAEYCHSSMQTVTGTWHNACSSSGRVVHLDVREYAYRYRKVDEWI
jgi:hypothetical protein